MLMATGRRMLRGRDDAREDDADAREEETHPLLVLFLTTGYAVTLGAIWLWTY
jgi:hypothetical protein